MGNAESSPTGGGSAKDKFASFPGSALVDALNCGGLDDTEDTPRSNKSGVNGTPHKTLSQYLSRMNTEELCAMSPVNSDIGGVNTEFDEEYEEFRPRNTLDEHDSILQSQSRQTLSMSRSQSPHPLQTPANNDKNISSSHLFAKALVSEVTDNPNTMTPAAMADRERRLLKAQEKARKLQKAGNNAGPRPVGTPGGVGQPSVLGSIAHMMRSNIESIGTPVTAANADRSNNNASSSVLPPNSLSENRAAQEHNNSTGNTPRGGRYTVTIGLSLSRRSSLGHPDTVTRQTAFDFNELQDRDYKYVSSTDSSGWRAGGGERGGAPVNKDSGGDDMETQLPITKGGSNKIGKTPSTHPGTPNWHEHHKVAAPDTVHIPIIRIDAESPQAVDAIISSLASGEVFIPHMAIIPEALSVNGVSPPDLVVRFGTERNDDLPPDEWPNWCLEFMHNQLYEYFQSIGARWMKRPFSITLAKKVRWKTVKHMNRYFAHAERVIDAWREKGPQYLDPQLAYIEGGATPDEVARPHGIYLLRNGVPTNYFAPNFDPPYTTKMTRSLLINVLGKSWDRKRREWTSQPIPNLVTPSMLATAMCLCTDNQTGGFVATEATLVDGSRGSKATSLPQEAAIRSASPKENTKKQTSFKSPSNIGMESPEPMSTAVSQNKTGYSRSNANDLPAESTKLAPEESAESNSGDDNGVDDNMDTRLDLQLSKSFDKSDANSNHAFSVNSSKYGRSPTPEDSGHRSQRRGVERPPNEDIVAEAAQPPDELETLRQEEEKENGNAVNSSGTVSYGNFVRSDVMQPSLATTNSTLMRTNISRNCKKAEHTQERKQDPCERIDEKKDDPILDTMASDEDWLDEVGNPIATPKQENCTEDDIMASLERESQRHLELIAMAQERTSTSVKKMDSLQVSTRRETDETLNCATKPLSPSTADTKSLSMRRSSSTNTSGRTRSPTSIRKNYSGTSGVSLEYSVDSTLIGESSVGGSTLNSTVGGSTVGSSLLGHHFAADGSTVMSTATRETLASAKEGIMEDIVQEASGSGEDSEEECIPTDEELYAVGWAKALDHNSGSYYYFTLDRSKIVWDNPLDPSSVSRSQSEESLQGAQPHRAAVF